jgi:toxin ParE1/3/4
LVKASFIGHQEQLLKERKTQYRYLVTRDDKLIYSVDEKNELIKIAELFETRQNPPILKRTV